MPIRRKYAYVLEAASGNNNSNLATAALGYIYASRHREKSMGRGEKQKLLYQVSINCASNI